MFIVLLLKLLALLVFTGNDNATCSVHLAWPPDIIMCGQRLLQKTPEKKKGVIITSNAVIISCMGLWLFGLWYGYIWCKLTVNKCVNLIEKYNICFDNHALLTQFIPNIDKCSQKVVIMDVAVYQTSSFNCRTLQAVYRKWTFWPLFDTEEIYHKFY